MYHLSDHDSCSVELRATLFSNDEGDLSQTPAAHELELALRDETWHIVLRASSVSCA